MVVAVKQKRSSRRLQSRPDDDLAVIADERPAAMSHTLSTVEDEPGPQAEAPEVPGATEAPEVQDLPPVNMSAHVTLASLIFDVEWYRNEYPDVAASNIDPVKHYFDNGSSEGRNPNRFFDTNWYASTYPDVGAADLNPFLHYLLYGAREGRKPAP